MANEIQMTAKITFDKGLVVGVGRDETDVNVDVAGTRYTQIVQEIGFAAEELISLGDVPSASLGYCHMKNLDATNFVQIRPATGVADMCKLKAGESCLFRWMTGITPYMIANTAAVDVEILIIED